MTGNAVRWLLLLGLIGWVASCGQKGPLYLPESQAPETIVTYMAP